MFYSLRFAEREDLKNIQQFANKAGVSTEGFDNSHFIIMETDHGEIAGCLGMEVINQDGLLRSCVVSSNLNQGHIISLLKSADLLMEQFRLKNIYFAVNKNSVAELLEIFGFKRIQADELPAHMLASNLMNQLVSVPNVAFMVK
ncbi:hypothetical protein NSQ41_18590 [Aeribacillus sp. FSL K6-8210]|uniref:GNAT family N-acetyltransferase n=1 Tax=Aeribacillus sp. FSL K6-8210 TaxID=2954683 RepID=UPI0030D4E34B